jgi:hypothetical protein
MKHKLKETPGYVMRHGRRIAVIAQTWDPPRSKSRPAFKARWVKLPRHWISSLGHSKSVNTYRLAHLILLVAYENKRGVEGVILSAKLTGDMAPTTRRRAARELEELGLITLKESGRHALQANIIGERG